MNRKCVHALLLTALLSCAATLTASPAQAFPYPDADQSVIITYYADSARTNEIGWRQYGHCGENYDIGVHSLYFSIEIGSCSSPSSGEDMSTISKSTVEQRRFPTDFPMCWDVEGKPCSSLSAMQRCTDGTFDDYVCTCTARWQWHCPEVR